MAKKYETKENGAGTSKGMDSASNYKLGTDLDGAQAPIQVPTNKGNAVGGVLLKFCKLSESAIIPSVPKNGDAGIDLVAVSVNETDDYVEYDTGLAVEIPSGYAGLLYPRSSNSKKDLLLCNSVGVVDSGYRGAIKLRFKRVVKRADATLRQDYEVGDRVAQLVITKVPTVEIKEVNSLTETGRGNGGFGSTGR